MLRRMYRFIALLLAIGAVAVSGCKSEKKQEEKPTTTVQPIESAAGGVSEGCRKLCFVVGKCATENGKCYADSPEKCRAAAGCKMGGLCTLKDRACQAVSAADCEQSDLCKTQGRCMPVNGRCENVSAASDH